jgi:hypothetical protein
VLYIPVVLTTGDDLSEIAALYNEDVLFDESHAATYLGGSDHPISVRTLQRWRFDGVGPDWCRVGRLVRYRRSALDRYLAARTRTSAK